MVRIKICPKCKLPKDFDEDYYHFPNGKSKGSCRQCQIAWQRARAIKVKEQYRERPDVRVPNEPYTYANAAQKESVDTFLKAIGWKKHGLIFYKKGFCDHTGKWNKMLLKNAITSKNGYRIGTKYKKRAKD